MHRILSCNLKYPNQSACCNTYTTLTMCFMNFLSCCSFMVRLFCPSFPDTFVDKCSLLCLNLTSLQDPQPAHSIYIIMTLCSCDCYTLCPNGSTRNNRYQSKGSTRFRDPKVRGCSILSTARSTDPGEGRTSIDTVSRGSPRIKAFSGGQSL